MAAELGRNNVYSSVLQVHGRTRKAPLAEKRPSEPIEKHKRTRASSDIAQAPKLSSIRQRLGIHNDRPSHAKFRLHPNGRSERVNSRHVESDRAHADAIDVAFGLLKKEGNGIALCSAVDVVRAFRVYEGDGLSNGNREIARRENEVSQVDRGICFCAWATTAFKPAKIREEGVFLAWAAVWRERRRSGTCQRPGSFLMWNKRA